MAIPDPDTRDPMAVLMMASGYRLARVVYAAAELGIADQLTDGALSPGELAAALSCDEPTLARLLRALAWHGLLRETSDGYALTGLGSCLRSDDASGARQMILGWTGLPETYLGFGRLTESVRSGRGGFELASGQAFYDYIAEFPERGAAYEAAMETTVESFESCIASHDFSGYRHVVDVGGGRGGLLLCLLRRYPDIAATLFDLPAVIESARGALAGDVADRITLVAGDALESVPAGADAYILSTVARCFDDDGCARLLETVAAAMTPASDLLLAEMIVPDDPMPLIALADLQALTVYGGADRTQDGWRALLGAAGLELRSIAPAGGLYSWIVARLRAS